MSSFDGGEAVDAAVVNEAITYEAADIILVIGTSFAGLMVLFTIASEKEARMLAALRTVGLQEWLYWLSWGLCYTVLTVVSTQAIPSIK